MFEEGIQIEITENVTDKSGKRIMAKKGWKGKIRDIKDNTAGVHFDLRSSSIYVPFNKMKIIDPINDAELKQFIEDVQNANKEQRYMIINEWKKIKSVKVEFSQYEKQIIFYAKEYLQTRYKPEDDLLNLVSNKQQVIIEQVNYHMVLELVSELLGKLERNNYIELHVPTFLVETVQKIRHSAEDEALAKVILIIMQEIRNADINIPGEIETNLFLTTFQERVEQ